MKNSATPTVRISAMINIVIVSLISLKAISPYCSRNMSPIIVFLLFIGWLFCTVGMNHFRISISVTPLLLSSVVLLAWHVLMRLIGISSAAWGNYIFRIVLYGLPIITFYILKMYTNKEKKLLLLSLICISLYNIIDNVYLWITSRESFIGLYFASSIENRLTNAGETEFGAFCMFLLPTFFLIGQYATGRRGKILGWSMLILDMYTIFFVNPHATIVLLTLVLLIILIYMHACGNNRNKKYISMIFILLIFPMMVFVLPLLLQALASILPHEGIRKKIVQIASILSGYEMDFSMGSSSFASRMQLALVSINSFLENIIFGLGEHAVGQRINDYVLAGIGGHSELLDYLAQYGLLGALPLAVVLHELKKMLSSQAADYRLKNIVSCVWVIFIIYSFMNKSFYLELFVPIFLILPTVLNLIKDSREKN